MSYHKVILVGHLGQAPEMRHTASGQQVANFSMATSEKWNGADGQAHERTIWWRVTVWGKSADNIVKYLAKGRQVLVEGRMNADEKGNPRTFQRNDGTTGASFEVTALRVVFLGSKGDGGRPNDGEMETEVEVAESAEIPF